MSDRPAPAAAFAVMAPDGFFSVPKACVALDVRCRCNEVLLRVINTQVGPLCVWRHHNPPTSKQLRAKGAGQWAVGEKQEARLVHGERRTSVADELATQVGWWEEPVWYQPSGDEAEVWTGGVRCRCGSIMVRERLRASVVGQLRSTRGRVMEAPRSALLDRIAHTELMSNRHRLMIDNEVARRRAET